MVSDALPEMIPLSEAFIQIWVRRQKSGKKESSNGEMAPPPPPGSPGPPGPPGPPSDPPGPPSHDGEPAQKKPRLYEQMGHVKSI